VRAVVRNWRTAPLSEKEKGMLAYAEKLTHAPSAMNVADIQELRACGWTDVDIHDATQVIAYFNYINRLADGLGVEPDAWLIEFERELDA
jgi:uncharacterized peroxidase-related enzyme